MARGYQRRDSKNRSRHHWREERASAKAVRDAQAQREGVPKRRKTSPSDLPNELQKQAYSRWYQEHIMSVEEAEAMLAHPYTKFDRRNWERRFEAVKQAHLSPEFEYKGVGVEVFRNDMGLYDYRLLEGGLSVYQSRNMRLETSIVAIETAMKSVDRMRGERYW